MSITLLEILREISEAQVAALRRRDFHAMNLLNQSRQELMLRMEKEDPSFSADKHSRIRDLLDHIFEAERNLGRECRSATLSCPEAVW